MPKLNGKKFKIYDIDTFELVKNRIAYSLSTIPEYLYIENVESLQEYLQNPENLEKEIDISAVSLIKEAKSEKTRADFSSFYSKYKNDFIKPLVLAKIWIAYNENIQANDIVSFSIQEQIAKILNVESRDIEELVESSKGFLKNLSIRIKNFSKREEETIQSISQFAAVKKIDSTDFTIQAANFTIYFDTDLSMFEVFNYMQLSEYCPFASLNDYYKIHKETKPPIEWAVSIPNYIILKVTDTSREDVIKLSTYRNVAISNENKKVKFDVEYTFTEKNVSKDMFIDRILSCMRDIDIMKRENISSVVENNLQGVSYFPRQYINNYIFGDLVMNNQLFSSFLSINESTKATKKKSSLYLKFTDSRFPKNEPLVATLSKKELQLYDKDTEMRKKFPVGTKYIRLKVSNARTVEIVKHFFNIMAKLFALYNELEDEILKIYQEYIPSFVLKIEKENIQKKDRLKDIAPEVFVSKYSKKCPAKEMPKIVSREEAMTYPSNRRMLFPKTEKEGTQRYYVCDDEKYIYPGLRKNTNLSNSEKFPYLPCCYVTDQTSKENSNYYKYYHGSGEDTYMKEQQTIFLTMKTATFGGFGILPKRLQSFFELLSIDKEYLRKGTCKSSSSFIECILESLYKETGFLRKTSGEITESIRLERTLEARKELSNWKFLGVGLQENYEKTVDEIKQELLDTDNYISPKKYKRILEEFYDCNIFIFSTDNEGELILPDFSQSYMRYDYEIDRPFIFILENKGTFAEKLNYPQCEIISQIDSMGNASYTIDYSDIIVKYTIKIYGIMSKSYKLDSEIPIWNIAFPKGYIPKYQYVDSYGKARIIRCAKGKKILDFTVEPIPPLRLEMKNSEIEYPLREMDKEILNLLTLQYKNFETGRIVELGLRLGNVEARISVDIKDLVIEDLPIKNVDSDAFTEMDDSLLEIYNYKKKISNYIIEYFFRGFSIFAKDGSELDILSFIEKGIVINNGIEKKIDKMIEEKNIVLPKSFDDEFFLLRKDGKLILPSREYLHRAIFALRMALKHEKIEILQYKDRINFRGIYTDISDFKKYPSQIIIKGEDMVDSWIQSISRDNCITDSIKIEPFGKEPYFFKNREISEKIYLAQNVSSISEGVYIYNLWERFRYNDRGFGYTEAEFNMGLVLWNYISREKIVRYEVYGKENINNINIIATKKGKIFYTILLDLSRSNKK